MLSTYIWVDFGNTGMQQYQNPHENVTLFLLKVSGSQVMCSSQGARPQCYTEVYVGQGGHRQEGAKQGNRTWKVPQGLLSPQNLEGRDEDCDSLQFRLTIVVLLGQFSFAEKWEHPWDTEVLGALDLGGASTQITFQPEVIIEDKNTSVFFRLYGTNYSLYTHSYLCYGQTQALKMLLAALHQVLQPLVTRIC